MAKLSTKKNKLWKLVSEYVRRRHADENGYTACYTCGTIKHWKEMDAGHAIPGRKNYVFLVERTMFYSILNYCGVNADPVTDFELASNIYLEKS